MKRLFLGLCFCLAFSFLSGCGGGGGSDSAPPPIALKTSAIRAFSSGDTWTFSMTGYLTNGTTTYNATGTLIRQILPTAVHDPLASTDCIDLFSTLAITGSGFAPINESIHQYGLQEANGTVREYGNNDAGWITTAPNYYVELVSPIVFGQTGGATVTYQDGSSRTYAYQVASSTANVATPLGTYEAYVVYTTTTYNYASGTITKYVSIATEYIVPGLGWVKIEETDSYYSAGDTFLYSLVATLVLSSTNVVY